MVGLLDVVAQLAQRSRGPVALPGRRSTGGILFPLSAFSPARSIASRSGWLPPQQ